MIHNVIEVGGLEYKAVHNGGSSSCDGCAFYDFECFKPEANCRPSDREDNQFVIFKRHYKLKDCK